MYCNAINPKLKILLRNYELSDDIAFRFSNQGWDQWPVTADKYVKWLNAIDPKHEVVNLFMDYETFGEHQWRESGIFDFMKSLPAKVFKHTKFTFNTPSELAAKLQPVSAIHVPYPMSWADAERDLTAWIGNELQDDAFDNLYALEHLVNQSQDPEIHKDWKYLQASDHFYYMCTKWFSDGDVHKYFNPYPTPYEAYINYMNVLADFRQRLEQEQGGSLKRIVRGFQEEISGEFKKQAEELAQKAREIRKKAKKNEEESGVKEITLEDIARLSNEKIKEFLKRVDIDDLVVALKDAADEVRDKVIPNLTKTARKRFDEFETEFRKFKKSDLKKYRDKVEKELRNLFK
jgi:alpha-amylase